MGRPEPDTDVRMTNGCRLEYGMQYAYLEGVLFAKPTQCQSVATSMKMGTYFSRFAGLSPS